MVELKIVKAGVEQKVLMGKQQINVSDISNVYSWDKCLQASFLVDIALPIEGNESIFGWKHLPAVRGGVYEWDARLYDGGRVLYYGKLQIRVSERDSFKGTYNFDFIASNLNSLIDEKSVREVLTQQVDMGSTITEIKEYMTDAAAASYPEYPVVFFPIYAPKFYGEDATIDFEGVCNYFKQSTGEFLLDEPLTVGDEPNNAWRYNVVPQVYMLAALKNCFEGFGYTVEGDALEDAFLKSICIEGKQSMDDIGGKTAILKTTTSQTFTAANTIDWGEITQDRIGSGVSIGTTPYTSPPGLNKWKLVLEIEDCTVDEVSVYVLLDNVSFLVKTILPEAGNTIVIEANGGEVIATHAWALSTAGSITLGVGSALVLSDEIGMANWVRGSFEIGECLPDVSVVDFLLACKQFGLEYIVDDVAKKVQVRVIKNMLEETVSVTPQYVGDAQRVNYTDENKIAVRYANDDVDTSGLPFVGNYYRKADVPATNSAAGLVGSRSAYVYIINENAYYKLTSDTNTIDTPLTIEIMGQRNSKVTLGNGANENEYAHRGKLSLITEFTKDSETYLAPWITDEGYTNFPGPDFTNFDAVKPGQWVLRFLQYYGMQDGSVGAYPLAGVSGRTYDGTALDVTHLTIDETDNGCWRRYLKPWLMQHLNRDEYERKLLPIVGESAQSLRGKRLYIDGQYYYAKEIKRGVGSDTPWSMVLVRRV